MLSLRNRILWTLAMLGTVLLASSALVFGQATRSELTISPPLFELSANPGDRLRHTIKLTNGSDVRQEISVDVRNFTALGEQGSVTLTEEDTSYSLANWVSVSPSVARISAGASRNFTFNVSVPLNAEPGGHFGSIVFRTADLGRLENAGGAALQQEIAALVLVKVAGDAKESISIVGFGANSLFSWDDNSINLNVRLENSGNVHLKPRGIITIKNIFGVEKAVINLDERNVLPDSIRTIANEWKPDGLALGYYSANLSLVYGSENIILDASTGFWVLPLSFLIPLLVVIGLAVFIGRRYHERIALATKVLLINDRKPADKKPFKISRRIKNRRKR